MASKGAKGLPLGYRQPIPNLYKENRGEPRTLEGRARKKLLMGDKYGLGCVLTNREMKLVMEQLPKEWLEKECK